MQDYNDMINTPCFLSQFFDEDIEYVVLTTWGKQIVANQGKTFKFSKIYIFWSKPTIYDR